MLDFTLIVLAVAIAVPVAVLCIEVFAGLLPSRIERAPSGRRPRVAILIPAHDEEVSIALTLRAVGRQLEPGDRLVVVADNCSDATAAIAATSAAEVVERQDRERRGKGYALDFGVQHLAAKPPEVVIVLDADCIAGPGAVDRLARLAAVTRRPVQARYEMAAGRDAGLKGRIAAFAWIVRNYARPLGLARLGLPCQLMGTGMAFPWEALRRAPLATSHITEDVLIGIELARAGTAPLFCPEASVESAFPASDAGMSGQRTRWEHGTIALISRMPGLLLQSLLRADDALASIALDLCVPPLALLLSLIGTLTLAASLLPGEGAALALKVGLAALAMFTAAVLAAWQRYGTHVLPISDLARVPVYMLWKLPIYLRFIIKRQSRWIRSNRAK